MKQRKFLKTATPYLFIMPWIIGFLVFTIGPLILSLIMSFFEWPLTTAPTFRGLGNYIDMFTKDKQFWKSLIISLKYAAIFVPLNMIIALFLAMLITQPVKGVKVFRTIFYIPAVISGVAVSIIWGWILKRRLWRTELSVISSGNQRNRSGWLIRRWGTPCSYNCKCVWCWNDDAYLLHRYQKYSG